jgi:hypothetical protein
MKPEVLGEYKQTIVLHLNEMQRRDAMAKLNVFYTGDVECNVRDTQGRFVAKYPEIEKNVPAFTESHYAAVRHYQTTVMVELLSDGSIRLKK